MNNRKILNRIDKSIKESEKILKTNPFKKTTRLYIEGKLTAYNSIKKLLCINYEDCMSGKHGMRSQCLGCNDFSLSTKIKQGIKKIRSIDK